MRKEQLIGVLVALVILLIGAVLYLLMTRQQGTVSTPPPVTNLDKNTTAPAVPAATANNNENKNFRTYQNNSFEFQYPANLGLTEQNGYVRLTHSVPYQHNSPCDFQGQAVPLKEITDFKLSLRYYPLSLIETAKTVIPRPSQVDYLDGDSFKLTPGFIDEYKVGDFKGFQITNAAEGCGELDYYIPLSDKATLTATRTIVSEFSPVIAASQEYLKVPGIIPPEQEKKIFESIVSSLKVK